MTAHRVRRPLIILGFDAGDPGWLEQWAQQGYLPTLASIMARGCWGRTAGPELICEHGIWVSMLSGVSRGRHGYYYFRQLKQGAYDLHNVRGSDLGLRPFWARLRGRDARLAAIDVPDGYVVPGLAGVQVFDWATHNPLGPPSCEPPELLEEASRIFGSRELIDEDWHSNLQQDVRIFRRLIARVRRKGELCRRLLSRGRFDVVIIVFAESHTGGHQFWKYRPEAERKGEENGELTNAIRDLYQAIDREAGLLLAQLEAEANVVVLSSVGLHDQFPNRGLIESFCRTLGYQAPAKAGPVSLSPLAVARRVIPEPWRVALSRGLSRDMRERLLADQFRRATNWRKTTAFAIPSEYTSFVRVNLRGREPEGIVEPGAEYEAMLERLESDLRLLVDPKDGRPAVTRITRSGRLFGPNPPRELPDLFVEWKPGSRFMDRVVHPAAELIQKKGFFHRGSDHSQSGFFAAAGPDVSGRGSLEEISVLDLAPTFLDLLGEPVPHELPGSAMRAVSARNA